MLLRRILLTALVLAACSSFETYWVVDMPHFQMQSLEWNVLASKRQVSNRCGLDTERTACVIRIREGGLCLVYSIYTEEQAKKVLGRDRLSIYEHEVEWHCRKGMTHDGAGN